jgi:hypothetical protein
MVDMLDIASYVVSVAPTEEELMEEIRRLYRKERKRKDEGEREKEKRSG